MGMELRDSDCLSLMPLLLLHSVVAIFSSCSFV